MSCPKSDAPKCCEPPKKESCPAPITCTPPPTLTFKCPQDCSPPPKPFCPEKPKDCGCVDVGKKADACPPAEKPKCNSGCK